MAQQGTVITNLLNMRNGAGTFAKAFTQLKQDTVVEILEHTNDEWVKVKLTDGREGYVAVAYLSLKDVETVVEVKEPETIEEVFKVIIATASLRVRAGASTDFSILGNVKQDAVFEVQSTSGEWYEISYADTSGYIHQAFTERYIEGVKTKRGFLIEQPELMNATLAPNRIIPREGLTPRHRPDVSATIWNEYGGLLQQLADFLHVPVASMVAVIGAESSGKAFGSDGRVIIRFEVHLFHTYWGKFNQELFDRHFKFESWRGGTHKFRSSINEEYGGFHGNQTKEHDVLEFARALDNNAALRCISMGMPQIMGFNNTRLGYESAQQMYDAFARSVHAQILGLFDFVKGTKSTSAAITALQNGDYVTFAGYYNGSANADKYGAIIADYVSIYNDLIKTAETAPSGSVADAVVVDEQKQTESPSVSEENVIPEDEVEPELKPTTVEVVDPPDYAVVAVPTTTLNFRDAPNGKNVIGSLKKGLPVTIIEPQEDAIKKFEQPESANQWLYLEDSKGQKGYAAAWLMIPSRLLTQAGVSEYMDKLPQRDLPAGYHTMWANQEKLGLPDPFDVLPVEIKSKEELANMQVNGYGTNTFSFWFWSKWYSRIGGMHNGYDFIVKTGTPLLAVSDGVIIKNWRFMASSSEITTVLWCFLPEKYKDANGNRMMSNVIVAYGHMSDRSQRKKHEVVKAGDVIGLSGTPAGMTTNDHLHYEVHLLQGDKDLPNGRNRSTSLLAEFERSQPLDNNTPWNPLMFYSQRLINYQLQQGDTVGYMGTYPDYPTVAMLKARGVHHLPQVGQLTLAYYRYGIPVVWNKPSSGVWSNGVITTDMLEERIKTYDDFEPYEATFLNK